MTDDRPDGEQEREHKPGDDAMTGVGLTAVLVTAHYLWVAFGMQRSGDFPEFDMWFVGWVQIAYVALIASVVGRGRPRMRKGALLASGLLFLLNSLLCGAGYFG